MISLETRLKIAADAEAWAHIVHRCPWCQRAFDEHGAYTTLVVVDERMVATDGMCPACGARALAHIAARRSQRARLAA